MGLDSGKGAHGTGVAYTFTRANEEDSDCCRAGGTGGGSRNRRQKKRGANATSVVGRTKATTPGMFLKKKATRSDVRLRVKGRLVNKGDMNMLEEFVKAGYV